MKFDLKSFVEDNLDNVRSSRGAELQSDCPFCGKSNHFYVNHETGKYVCHKCGEAARRPVALIAHVEGITVAEAWKMLRKLSVKRRRKAEPATLVEKMKALRPLKSGVRAIEERVEVPLPDEYIPIHKDGRWRMPVYLKQRGVTKASAAKWKLGYCKRGRYADRIILPMECPNGYSFTSRDAGCGREPKYLNPPDADHNKMFYGWVDDKVGADVTLVEGPLDVIKMDQHGLFSLGVLGKTLKKNQLRLLSSWPRDSSITVMVDPEEEYASIQIAYQLINVVERVYIAKLPCDIDPGSSSKTQAWDAYENSKRFTGDRSAVSRISILNSSKKLGKIYQL